MDNNELKHHGVPGMKWGVRRYRQKARAAYSASSRTFGEKRRQKVMDNARKYDEIADQLELGNEQVRDEIRSINKQRLKRTAKIGAAAAAGCLAVYGGYKLNEFLNSCSYTINGKSVSRQVFASTVKAVARSLS